MFCSACGKQIGADDRFCAGCGAQQRAPERTPANDSASDQFVIEGKSASAANGPKIVCPHCGDERQIPRERIPTKEVKVSCPKCHQWFTIGTSIALSSNLSQNPSVSQGTSPGSKSSNLPNTALHLVIAASVFIPAFIFGAIAIGPNGYWVKSFNEQISALLSLGVAFCLSVGVFCELKKDKFVISPAISESRMAKNITALVVCTIALYFSYYAIAVDQVVMRPFSIIIVAAIIVFLIIACYEIVKSKDVSKGAPSFCIFIIFATIDAYILCSVLSILLAKK